MKKIITVLIIALAASSFVFAQTTEHIVKKGETLESIAALYNVTKQQIVSINPSAAKFIYTGQKLIIPSKKAEIPSAVQSFETKSVEVNEVQSATESLEPWELSGETPIASEVKTVPYTSYQSPIKVAPSLDFGLFDINFPLPDESFNWGQHYSIGAALVFDDLISLSFDIGYKWNSATVSDSASGYYMSSKQVSHFIQFCPSIGIGDFNTLAFNLGLDVNCFLGGKQKMEINQETTEKKMSATGVKPLLGPKVSLTIGHYCIAYCPLFSSGDGLASHSLSIGIRY